MYAASCSYAHESKKEAKDSKDGRAYSYSSTRVRLYIRCCKVCHIQWIGLRLIVGCAEQDVPTLNRKLIQQDLVLKTHGAFAVVQRGVRHRTSMRHRKDDACQHRRAVVLIL